MTGLADALGHHWGWGFDSLGRNHTKADPDAGTWNYGFDDAGRTLLQTDAKSQQTSFTYDAAGRLWTRTNPDETVTFRYGEPRSGYFNVARLTSVDAVGRPLTIDYDALGRAVHRERVLDGVTYSETTRLDPAGRLKGITFPDGDAFGTPADPIRYDAAGRTHSVPGVVTSVTYDASGNSLLRTNSNLTETSRTYSPARGFLTGITTHGNGTTIQDLAYTPDTTGMVQAVTSPKPDESWTYGYDALNRLTSASAPGRDQTFTYDILGRMTFNSEVGAYTYSPSRPHAPDTIAGQQLTYDVNGNMLTGRGRTIAWTAANLPTQVNGTTFTYGGQGERVKKTSAGLTSLYPLGDDYEVTNGVVTKYLNLPGLGLVAKRVGPETFWLHTDRLGSVQAVTAADGSEVLRRTYRPYGDEIADSGSHLESRGYIGQRADDGTDLLYLHARYYDPEIAAFVSRDPVGPGPDAVVYGYSGGDPVNRKDPSGLYYQRVCEWVMSYENPGEWQKKTTTVQEMCHVIWVPDPLNPWEFRFPGSGTPSSPLLPGVGGRGGAPSTDPPKEQPVVVPSIPVSLPERVAETVKTGVSSTLRDTFGDSTTPGDALYDLDLLIEGYVMANVSPDRCRATVRGQAWENVKNTNAGVANLVSGMNPVGPPLLGGLGTATVQVGMSEAAALGYATKTGVTVAVAYGVASTALATFGALETAVALFSVADAVGYLGGCQ